MQTIPFHIAYLLTRHECVIIPDLGAFIVSESENRESVGDGQWYPPLKFLGFNPDIRHNDGLLAHSLAKSEDIPYRDARLQIRRYVERLNELLENQMQVFIPWVGTLTRSAERKMMYNPSSQLSCNADYFGMYNLYMPLMSDLEKNEEYEVVEETSKKRWLMGWQIAVIAAVMILLYLIARPLTDQWGQSPQSANVVPVPDVVPSRPVQTATTAVPENTDELLAPETTPKPAPTVAAVSDSPCYYVIVASFATEAAARLQMSNLQADDVPAAGIVSNGERYRVYAQKFKQRREAETFLAKFKFRYFDHQDAWIVKQ